MFLTLMNGADGRLFDWQKESLFRFCGHGLNINFLSMASRLDIGRRRKIATSFHRPIHPFHWKRNMSACGEKKMYSQINIFLFYFLCEWVIRSKFSAKCGPIARVNHANSTRATHCSGKKCLKHISIKFIVFFSPSEHRFFQLFFIMKSLRVVRSHCFFPIFEFDSLSAI